MFKNTVVDNWAFLRRYVRRHHNRFANVASISVVGTWAYGSLYRKAVTITGSATGAQTDYPVMVTISFVAAKMQTDFSDVFFQGADGNMLPFWRETYTDSTSAVFWVKVPSIPIGAGTVVIYAYYGSGKSLGLSNGEATFSFFDDFDRNWTIERSQAVLKNDAGYTAFGITIQKDANTLIHLTRKGTSHAADKGSLVMATYDTLADTWSAYSTIYTDGTYDSRNCGGGLIGGVIYLFFARYDFGGGTFFDIGYITSSDYGATWSGFNTLNKMGFSGVISPHGKLIEVNGTYLLTFYVDNGAGTYTVALIKSTDKGATWVNGATIYSGAVNYNEADISGIGGSNVIAVIRKDGNTNGLFQAVSSDGGATWGAVTLTNLTNGNSAVISDCFYDGETGKILCVYRFAQTNAVYLTISVAATVFADASQWVAPITLLASNGIGYASIVRLSTQLYYICHANEVNASTCYLYGGVYGPAFTAKGKRWATTLYGTKPVMASSHITIDNDWIRSNDTFAVNTAMRFKRLLSTTTGEKQMQGFSTYITVTAHPGDIANNGHGESIYATGTTTYITNTNGLDGNGQKTSNNADTNSHVFEIQRNTTTNAHYHIDDTEMTNSPIATNIQTDAQYIHLSDYDSTTGSAQYEWVLVRKFVYPEPTNSVGSEQAYS